MKTKSINKFAAVFLALAMLLTLIPLSPFGNTKASAATDETQHTLDVQVEHSSLVDKDAEETLSAAKSVDNFFTVSSGIKAQCKGAKSFAKTSAPGGASYSPTNRYSMAAFDVTAPDKNSIKFTTTAPATVEVWWAVNSAGRQLVIADSDKILESFATGAANEAKYNKYDLNTAGTYYIGNVQGTAEKDGGNYVYKVVVTEKAAEGGDKPTTEVKKDFTLDIATEFPDGVADGTWSNGQKIKAGTDKFFSILAAENMKVTTSTKTFKDGDSSVSLTTRLGLQGSLDLKTPSRAIKFTTGSDATVKVYFATGGSAGRYLAVADEAGTIIANTPKDTTGNTPYVETIELSAAGTYLLGAQGGGCDIYKIVVNTVAPPKAPRAEWSSVAAPSVKSAAADGGKITVEVTALIDDDGGDSVKIDMLDGDKVVKSITSDTTNPTVEFTPTASGSYTFKATLSRDGETTVKESAVSAAVEFTLPLAAPELIATSKGGGRVELVWDEVPEAEKYIITYGDETITTTDAKTTYMATGLTVGETYTFTVKAVRGDETSDPSNEAAVEVTEDAVINWDFVFYGTSTGADTNKHKVNDDGSVQVITEGGKAGKIQYENKFDGLGFYHTRVSTTDNFSLKAKVKVDDVTVGSQTGFGLLALDSYPAYPNKNKPDHYTNQFMAGVYKFEYFWDFENNEIPYDKSGTKYTMTHGIGVTRRFGITDSTGDGFKTQALPLEMSNIKPENESGTYKFEYGVGSEFIFELGRNNTGYYAAYYTTDGKLVGEQQFYDPDALSVLDKNSIYVGFFTGRDATATFSVIDFKTWDKASDTTPVKEQPITYVNPAAPINSATISNSSDYTLIMTPNVKGTITVSVNGVEETEKITVTKPKTVLTKDIKLVPGKNEVVVTFKPVSTADQGFEYEYIQLRSDAAVTSTITVNYNTDYANQNNLYIAPDGKATGNGGPEYPLDIYTAVKVVQPGQTIVVMEGTYDLTETVTIQRGVDGEEGNLIRMIADPEAKTRPVFDFGGVGGGIRLGGNYWYLRGFDVTKTADKATGFRVCGNNNTLDQINTYTNGNTGIQISAFRDSSDPKEMWPKNNLILNCNSFDNADSDGNDADGFAAKLTCGEGNVFDGCIAYNNCDDGWDLFSKPTTGTIGSVTIRNCIAYNNGHNLSGKINGDGNGFKLGGSDMSGEHVIENSIAFNNDLNGITSNSAIDATVKNCTSYNNNSKNLTLYSSKTPLNYIVDGMIVCGASGYDIKDNTNNKDSQIRNVKTVTENDFESTTFGGPKRNADGTIDLGDFLKLKDTTAGGADLDKEGGSTSSGDVGTITPDENLPDPKPETPPTDSSDSSGAVGTIVPPTSSGDNTVDFKDTDIEVTAPSNAFDNADEIKFNADPVAEETTENTFTFDLSFTDGSGNKVQPKVAVTVKIPVPAALVGKTIYVYHVESNGSYTEIDCKVENGMVVFTASSFSKYIITSEKLNAANDPGNSGNNSETPESPETSNPSTGAALPAAGMIIALASAAAVCVTKRKH